ncbi:MAG: hypothetical protein FJ102_04420 [Deltaproteobacteria bacterium]|nr:hypothetical protein [Deltaproteobacteria bacterium]
MILFLLGCPGSGAADKSDEAWPEWEEPEAEDSGAPVEAAPEVEEEYDACEPESCIELAEAVDRGFATINYGLLYLKIDNAGPYPVCFEDWYVFTSDGSQDALAGIPGQSEIPAGGSLSLPYGLFDETRETWWCVEENQSTARSGSYDYDGARAPDRLFTFADTETDEDADLVEDHVDAEDEGLVRTQHNVWDEVQGEVLFLVGREMNWFDLSDTRSAAVALRVTNLGREGGTAMVSETLPPGWTPSAYDPEPVSVSRPGDGSTVIAWAVRLDGAVDGSSSSEPAEYDVASLRYTLDYENDCQAREQGFAPTARWTGIDGRPHDSEGSPLVIECCAPEEEFTGPEGTVP